MTPEIIGLLGLLGLVILIFLRVPVSISMLLLSIVGITYMKSWSVLSNAVHSIIWENSLQYTFVTIPMFVLMGNLLYESGITGELYGAFKLWLGKLRGGLALATLGASGIFAASSGSSMATAATIGLTAAKEMTDAGYSKSFSSAAILGGGTLGPLIPPSTLLIMYGFLTNQSIKDLLIAGIVPGILLTLLYMLYLYFVATINPRMAPKTNLSATWKERFYGLRHVFWIVLLFFVVILGMTMGFSTPTESAGFGAFGAFVVALLQKKLNVRKFLNAVYDTVATTGMIFAIVLPAFLFTYFISITRIPAALTAFFSDLELSRLGMFIIIIVVYLILGMVLDNGAMMVVTIPIVIPIMQAYDFDLVWFGIIMIVVIEMGLITPPVGMLAFVLDGVAPYLGLKNVFKGGMLILVPILVFLVLMYVFPEIALFLPHALK